MECIQVPQRTHSSPIRRRVGIGPNPRDGGGRSNKLSPDTSKGEEEELFIGVIETRESF